MTATRALVLRPGDTAPSLEYVQLPDLGDHQVMVAITGSGVCHSQLNQIAAARDAPPDRAPLLLGHEGTGTVVATGAAVRGVRTGDHVLVTWVPRHSLLDGRTPTVAHVRLATGGTAAANDVFTFADTTIADEAYLFPIPGPEAVPDLAVLGCAVITGAGAVLRTAAVGPGGTVAVIGVGGVGTVAVAAARAAGAAKIFALDIDDTKLAHAARLGATHTLNTRTTDPATAVGPEGVDAVIDCVTNTRTIDQAVRMARPGITGLRDGGTIVLVGVPHAPLDLDARTVQLRQLRIIGGFGGSAIPDVDFPRYLAWCADGTLDLGTYVTRRRPLDEVIPALDELATGRLLGRSIVTTPAHSSLRP